MIFAFTAKEIPYRGIGSDIKWAMFLYPQIEFEGRTDKSIEYEIAALRREGKIEFCGALKTGGYYVKGDGNGE